MIRADTRFFFVVLAILLWCLPTDLRALTAQEILDQSTKQNLGESFRIALTVKTYKAKKLLSDQILWLMAQIRKDGANFFVDFDSPPESKGMRFLLLVRDGTAVPEIKLAQCTQDMDWSQLELHVFAKNAPSASGLVFLPGESEAHELTLTKSGDSFKLNSDPLAGKVKWKIHPAKVAE